MRAIVCMLGVALVCGAGIFVFRLYGNGFGGPQGCWWIVAVAALAGFLGIFYSAPPFKFGYRGLGEPVIGIIFGPLLMTGCFYAAAGCVSSEVLWLSAAVGLLVMNILYTHSFIDITDAQRIAAAWAVNLLPYLLVVGAAVFGYLSPFYLLVLFVLPRSLWLCGSLRDFAHGQTGAPDMPPLILGNIRNWDRGFCAILILAKLLTLIF